MAPFCPVTWPFEPFETDMAAYGLPVGSAEQSESVKNLLKA